METLALKYNSQFIVNHYNTLLPEGSDQVYRIRDMNEQFRTALTDPDPWDKKKLYLVFMCLFRCSEIKAHIIEYPHQDVRWKELIHTHLPELIKKHLNFKLNAVELVCQSLNIFFII